MDLVFRHMCAAVSGVRCDKNCWGAATDAVLERRHRTSISGSVHRKPHPGAGLPGSFNKCQD